MKKSKKVQYFVKYIKCRDSKFTFHETKKMQTPIMVPIHQTFFI